MYRGAEHEAVVVRGFVVELVHHVVEGAFALVLRAVPAADAAGDGLRAHPEAPDPDAVVGERARYLVQRAVRGAPLVRAAIHQHDLQL